ncbi:hypothetical protein AJ80_05064, partial [Polytolypa hystricis UAMH7299]
MFRPSIARHIVRAGPSAAAVRATSRPALTLLTPTRNISSSRPLWKDDKPAQDDRYRSSTTAAPAGESAEHEGQFARTDENVRVEYPADAEMPRSPIVQGRGGMHFKRTLASFSLEGRVSVVTGGARGLGLVMGQALVNSGSDLAIVDLNKDEADEQVEKLIEQFKMENPGLE